MDETNQEQPQGGDGGTAEGTQPEGTTTEPQGEAKPEDTTTKPTESEES